jgi:hypothetical protein
LTVVLIDTAKERTDNKPIAAITRWVDFLLVIVE